MAQKFEYDETGNNILYVVTALLGIILLPSSYYFWPNPDKRKGRRSGIQCNCDPCTIKEENLKRKEPKKQVQRFFIRITLLLAWIFFSFLAYKITQIDYEYANFDPFEILGVSTNASNAEIRKAYRQLSLIYHPDKETGDETIFIRISKAHQALTDETARKNWEEFGNPDGPSATRFGIALPAWITEKENSVIVLGLYALAFMVVFPTVVGIWWYRSIQYSSDDVLLDTTKLYRNFFLTIPQMLHKKVLNVLCASKEFETGFNPQVPGRAADDADTELQHLIKPILKPNDRKRVSSLSISFIGKVKSLVYAHLSRRTIESDILESDRQLIVSKSPLLLQEMISCVSSLIMIGEAQKQQREAERKANPKETKKVSKFKTGKGGPLQVHSSNKRTRKEKKRREFVPPNLNTFEAVLKISPMIVQALWETGSPLMQLPHVTEDIISMLPRRHKIMTVQRFYQMGTDERREFLGYLSDDQYEDVMSVCESMPEIELKITYEVLDDEESAVVTSGSLVTVTVSLTRKSLGGHPEMEKTKDTAVDSEDDHSDYSGAEETKERGDPDEDKENRKVDDKSSQPKKPVWQKKRGGAKKKGGKGKVQNQSKKPAIYTLTSSPKDPVKQSAIPDDREDSDDNNNGSEGSDDEDMDKDVSDIEEESMEEWKSKIAKRKDKVMEGRSKDSHPVHCPYFPEVKQEYWWAYICDKRNNRLLCPPYFVTNLVEQEEFELQFAAPKENGHHRFNLWLRSDSYFGFDKMEEIKLFVQEGQEIKEHKQWEFSESEQESSEELASDSENE